MTTAWASIVLLTAVTFCYAGYNIFIKLSGNVVPESATTTVLATISLQLAALVVSVVFYLVLVARGGSVFSLSSATYGFAVLGGICIGCAEIGYLYLFSGLGGMPPMQANMAIPVVVSGTIVIALIFSSVFLSENIGLSQLIGSGLIVSGIAVFFLP